MKNIGLVCEGGGLREIYTTGVLDFFLDKGLEFPYLVGVSAGAIYPASYVSKQKGRNLEIQKKYLRDPRYMSFRNLLFKGNFFDPEFAYYRMTKELVPFDYDVFKNSSTNYKAGVFNCLTGKTEYKSREEFFDVEEAVTAMLASGSIPFLSKEVWIKGVPYLDGGIASPIPLYKSIKDGNERNVVILTQPEGYQKSPLKYKRFTEIYYKKYPKVAAALLKRHEVYNSYQRELKKLQAEGSIFVIRPSEALHVDRLERDITKVEKLYELGYRDARRVYEEMMEWAK